MPRKPSESEEEYFARIEYERRRRRSGRSRKRWRRRRRSGFDGFTA